MDEISSTILSTKEGTEKYDVTLKQLLSDRQFLARILKRFVPEYADYPLREIEERFIEPESITVSKVGVDLISCSGQYIQKMQKR